VTSLSVGKFGSAVYLPGATIGPRAMSEFQLVPIASRLLP